MKKKYQNDVVTRVKQEISFGVVITNGAAKQKVRGTKHPCKLM
jgi:hypothetical protein